MPAETAVASISRSARLIVAPGMIVDEQLVREAAQVDAERGREVERGEDPGKLGQPTDKELLLGAAQPLVVACHVSLSRGS